MAEKPETYPNGEQGKISDSSIIHQGLSRRDLIRGFALACGGLLSSTVLAGVMGGAREPGGPVRKGQILSESQVALLRELVEVIIPRTETPGAAETDTHGFIDDQLAHCVAPADAEQFIAELDRFGVLVLDRWGADFQSLPPQQKQEAMTALALKQQPFEVLPEEFFHHLKALTVVGYYSSEAGATQELVYLPIPGGYSGNFKVSENDGRAFFPRVF